MNHLNRFIEAQETNKTYIKACQELQNGAKKTHWIWYVFPQIRKLGVSDTAIKYGIDNFEEACNYLKNQKLFDNYKKSTLIVLEQLNKGIPLQILMGSEVDAIKLASSMTLFQLAGSFLAKQGNQDYVLLAQYCEQILTKIKSEGYKRCQTTIDFIAPQIKAAAAPSSVTALAPKVASPVFFTKNTSRKQETPNYDYSDLSQVLNAYIEKRETEWRFHYNFLGLIAIAYWIKDVLSGTDHFNSKSREIKISAARKLKQSIDDGGVIKLSNPERLALHDGRLGKIVANYGELDTLMEAINSEKIIPSHQP